MILFPKHNPDALLKAFSRMISNGKLSRFAQLVASSGRRLAKNILASECITGYGRILESVINFPSDALLPSSISQLHNLTWEWNLFRDEIVLPSSEVLNIAEGSVPFRKSSVVLALEEEFIIYNNSKNGSDDGTKSLEQDVPDQLDWNVLEEIESSEEYENLEMEEVCCFMSWFSTYVLFFCMFFSYSILHI